MKSTLSPTLEDYAAAFAVARARDWPAMTALEQERFGFALDREKLEAAARVLACPVKEHEANWQHGRLIYAMTRAYLATHADPVTLLDVGSAKGFSALCLQWALLDSGRHGAVVSVDVLDPHGVERRNSVAELDGPKTLYDFVAPWPEARAIAFHKSTGINWLERHPGRVHIAFIDGKHSGSVVWQEGVLLAERQELGDLVLFDDVQIDGVGMAVKQLHRHYTIETIALAEHRAYAIGVRRG